MLVAILSCLEKLQAPGYRKFLSELLVVPVRNGQLVMQPEVPVRVTKLLSEIESVLEMRWVARGIASFLGMARWFEAEPGLSTSRSTTELTLRFIANMQVLSPSRELVPRPCVRATKLLAPVTMLVLPSPVVIVPVLELLLTMILIRLFRPGSALRFVFFLNM